MAMYIVAYDLIADESTDHYTRVIAQIMLSGVAKEIGCY